MNTVTPILKSFQVFDNFCPMVDEVRQSALDSGFGTWKPNKGEVGSSVYDGMNFWGNHAMMIHSLSLAIGKQVFPNSMFFRVTNTDTEKAYVHSDRESGSNTCVAYLSEHAEVSGTAFFRHRASGMTEMPPFALLKKARLLKRLSKEMVSGGIKEWEQLDFVRGTYNRALVFRAPLFHARCPKHGIGNNSKDGRMVWVCHYETTD